MNARILAATAVTLWSKVGAAAVVLPGVSATPAVANSVVGPPLIAGTCPNGPTYIGHGPTIYGSTISVQALTSYKGSAVCTPGTLRLQASPDHTHWKTIASAHTTPELGGATVTHDCLAGTWWYQSQFTTDD